MAKPAQRHLQRGQTRHHVVPPAPVPHGADPPDPAVQRAERGSDLQAEVLEQRRAHRIPRDAVGDVHAGHVGHLVGLIAEQIQPHGGKARSHRTARPGVAVEPGFEPLVHHDAGAFPRCVEHGGRLGVVVQPRLAPVVHQHRQIEVVRLDDAPGAGLVVIRTDTLLHVPARPHHRLHPVVEGHRRDARRAGQALLQPGGHRVELPGVGLQRHAGDRRGGVDMHQRAVVAADAADRVQRLGHGGRRVSLHEGDELRAVSLHCVLDLLRVEHRAPLGLDGDDLGPAAVRDLAQQVPEPPEDRHQHPVARLQHGDQNRLDAGAGGAIDQQRPAVGGAEHLPVERHHLVHVLGETRIELPEQRQRHCLQHARVDIHRAGTHQAARRRVQGFERLVHEGSSCMVGSDTAKSRENTARPAKGGTVRWRRSRMQAS